MKYKNVIFFSLSHSRSQTLFSEIKDQVNHHLFKCSQEDEVIQILKMSDKTVIMIDNSHLVRTLCLKLLSFKQSTRIYFLDWTGEKISLGLSSGLPVETIAGHDKSGVISEINYYLEEEENFELQKFCFFTVMLKVGEEWTTLASSHDGQKLIDKKLGVKWTDHRNEILNNIKSNTHSEKLLPSGHIEIVYPYILNGEVVKVAIVHFPKDPLLRIKIKKIKSFLAGINDV